MKIAMVIAKCPEYVLTVNANMTTSKTNAQCAGLHLTLEQWTTHQVILMAILMDSEDGDGGLGFSLGLDFSHFSSRSSSFSGAAVGFKFQYIV